MTDQKNDLPEMPLTFKSDDDPNIELKILKDDQGDFWLSLRSPDKGMISFRACTIQGGGHRDNRRLWRNLLDFWKHSFDGAKYIRADRPAAVDVDEKALKQEIFGWAASNGFTPLDSDMDDLLWRMQRICGHLTPSPAPVTSFIERQKPLDPDFAKVLNENAFDLYERATPAPTGERAEALSGKIVHLVYVLDDDFYHVFSTKEKAEAFASTKECPCVICDYIIDEPGRFYEEYQ